MPISSPGRGSCAGGTVPKEIARALGVRPSTVAPLMRVIAQQAAADEPEPAVMGCWVSPGWSAGLTIAGHEEWPDLDLVWGALDYARELGFPPHPDFQPASGHLGTWQETSDITFGRDGVPFYVSGPYDDAAAVTRTLTRSAGEGNFHYVAQIGASAGW